MPNPLNIIICTSLYCCKLLSSYTYVGVTNLMNTTNSEDTITVTWDAANSPYCGGVLYYIVMISSDEHSNIMNDIVNVTDLSLLTATFSNLMNDTYYDVTVTTTYSRLVEGRTTTVNVRTSSSIPTQSISNNASNNGSNNAINNPGCNNTGMYVLHIHSYVYIHII